MLRYQEPEALKGVPLGSQIWHEGLERAARVARFAEQLEQEGWRPDLILAHTGWGETLGLQEVWPFVPQILWPELWVRPEHGGYGIDPLKPPAGLGSRLEQLGRNALTRTALAAARAWVLPTRHQAESLPPEFCDQRLHVIHEGIDTRLAHPKPEVSFEVRGVSIDRSVPTITFVNRNLERLRGFDLIHALIALDPTAAPEGACVDRGRQRGWLRRRSWRWAAPTPAHASGVGRPARSGADPLSWAGAPSDVDGAAAGQLGACISQLSLCARLEPAGGDGLRLLHRWQPGDAGGGSD